MDTIGLVLKNESVPNTNFLEEIPVYLTEIFNDGISVSNYGVETINGKLGNFKVSITQKEVKVYGASLQKYFEGNNVSPFSRSRTKQAFEQLEAALHLPIMDKAIVNKFHFAKPIIVKHPTSLYLPYLGNLKGYKRLEQPNGLNYKNAYREICLYDKIKELKSNREEVPTLYKKTNLLRIEKKFERQICKQFNVSIITPALLVEENFYINLCDDFYKTYNQISKIKTFKKDMNLIKNVSEYKNLGVSTLIEQQGGISVALNDIEERLKKGLLTKGQAGRLKDLVKKCSSIKTQTIESELMVELDQKVKESILYYR